MVTISCFSEIQDNSILYRLEYPDSLKKYFLKNSGYIQYDRKIELAKIDRSILSIPVLSVIGPVAWAIGASVKVPCADAAYLESLEKMKDVYHTLFPGLSCAGSIQAEVKVNNIFSGKRDAVLFSGGVDSLCSYISHKEEKPDLISIWGVPDIPSFEEKYWKTMWQDISYIANQDGVQAYQVKTDIFRNINHELLNLKFARRDHGTGWWNGFASVPFLTGMCAPITAARETGTLHIASSYPPGYQGVSAFHESIVQCVRWAGMAVVQDDSELSRQQKVSYICRNDHQGYLSHLRVCFDSALHTNCGKCEKCYRTITALTLAGKDPNRCNFKVNGKTFTDLKKHLINRVIRLSSGQQSFWLDIQQYIPERVTDDFYGSREFLVWLKTFDLTHYKTNMWLYNLWMAGLYFSNRRIKPRAIWRKARCYYYILADKRL